MMMIAHTPSCQKRNDENRPFISTTKDRELHHGQWVHNGPALASPRRLAQGVTHSLGPQLRPLQCSVALAWTEIALHCLPIHGNNKCARQWSKHKDITPKAISVYNCQTPTRSTSIPSNSITLTGDSMSCQGKGIDGASCKISLFTNVLCSTVGTGPNKHLSQRGSFVP